jgi:hypothetical protein
MACAGFEKLRDHAVEHLPGGEFANPSPHVVKAANTIGEATNDRIESMFGISDKRINLQAIMFYFMFGCIYPDMCIAYNITSFDRSIGHYLQTL